jgi:hypothetical protein
MSKCEKDENGYHDPIRFHDYPDAVVEGCKLCNRKLIYNKHDGRINEAEYYNDHIRDFAQPYGSTRKIFERIYGKAGGVAVRRAKDLYGNRKSKDQIAREWDETLKDSQREMRRMNEQGKEIYL